MLLCQLQATVPAISMLSSGVCVLSIINSKSDTLQLNKMQVPDKVVFRFKCTSLVYTFATGEGLALQAVNGSTKTVLYTIQFRVDNTIGTVYGLFDKLGTKPEASLPYSTVEQMTSFQLNSFIIKGGLYQRQSLLGTNGFIDIFLPMQNIYTSAKQVLDTRFSLDCAQNSTIEFTLDMLVIPKTTPIPPVPPGPTQQIDDELVQEQKLREGMVQDVVMIDTSEKRQAWEWPWNLSIFNRDGPAQMVSDQAEGQAIPQNYTTGTLKRGQMDLQDFQDMIKKNQGGGQLVDPTIVDRFNPQAWSGKGYSNEQLNSHPFYANINALDSQDSTKQHQGRAIMYFLKNMSTLDEGQQSQFMKAAMTPDEVSQTLEAIKSVNDWLTSGGGLFGLSTAAVAMVTDIALSAYLKSMIGLSFNSNVVEFAGLGDALPLDAGWQGIAIAVSTMLQSFGLPQQSINNWLQTYADSFRMNGGLDQATSSLISMYNGFMRYFPVLFPTMKYAALTTGTAVSIYAVYSIIASAYKGYFDGFGGTQEQTLALLGDDEHLKSMKIIAKSFIHPESAYERGLQKKLMDYYHQNQLYDTKSMVNHTEYMRLADIANTVYEQQNRTISLVEQMAHELNTEYQKDNFIPDYNRTTTYIGEGNGYRPIYQNTSTDFGSLKQHGSAQHQFVEDLQFKHPDFSGDDFGQFTTQQPVNQTYAPVYDHDTKKAEEERSLFKKFKDYLFGNTNKQVTLQNMAHEYDDAFGQLGKRHRKTKKDLDDFGDLGRLRRRRNQPDPKPKPKPKPKPNPKPKPELLFDIPRPLRQQYQYEGEEVNNEVAGMSETTKCSYTKDSNGNPIKVCVTATRLKKSSPNGINKKCKRCKKNRKRCNKCKQV